MTQPTDLSTLRERIWSLDNGPEKVAALEEAVRLADLQQDTAEGYDLRKELVRAALYAGQSEKIFPAFAWCLDHLDHHAEELGPWEAWQLAWFHKWIIGNALDFPQIPWERIEALNADFAVRARALGALGNTTHNYDLALAKHRGDRTAAQTAFGAWQAAGRDRLSNCPACEAQEVASFYRFMGNDDACIQQSRKIVEQGQGCAHIPHTTYAAALRPLLRQGETEQAAEYAAKGRRLVAGKPDHLSNQADHLEYLALTDPAAGLKWYARHLSWAEESRELADVMDFHAAAALLFTRLQHGSRRQTRKLQLLPSVPGYREDGLYSVAERLDHHLSEAQRIAALFDARNGTNYHTAQLAKTMRLTENLPEESP